MNPLKPLLGLATCLAISAAEPKLPAVTKAMEEMIAKNEIAGAVTMVVTREKILHLDSTGFADVEAKRPMADDTLFWIASMTKPVAGAALLMLQDEGKLKMSDPVAKYIPEFAKLKTPSGKPANLTIAQIMTHTSGLGEAPREKAQNARTLADLVPMWLEAPMQFEPGTKWSYCQSGINAGSRIVEVISGMSFDQFLEKRLFAPLGMRDTTFYPTEAQRKRLVTAYAKNRDTGELQAVPPRADFGSKDRPPQGNGGLFSTAPDYARFCQMLLNGGTLDGKRYLSAEAMKFLNSSQTGDLPTGFFQNDTYGNRGKNYGWGIGTCVLKEPHEGVAEALSAGTFGHGGAWGTQAWIDPVKGRAYVLMVQRSNFPNSDASDVRRAFQNAASEPAAKTSSTAANTASLAKELEPFRPFLKTWKGTFIGGKNPNPMTDVCTFERALNGQAIRIIHSVNDGIYGGETLLVFNAASKQIDTYYFTTSADVSQGTMDIDRNGVITSIETFKGDSNDPNSVTKARATSKLLPDGRFHVKSEYLRKSGEWVPGHEIIYTEAPGADVVFK